MKYQIKERGPETSDSQIRLLEHKLGKQLPREYREFLVQTNGGNPGDLEFHKESGEIDSIKAFYGVRGEAESEDLLWSRKLLEDRLGPERFLPIAHTPFGDIVILDLETGGVLLWIDDGEESDVEILAENFEEFWNALEEPDVDAPECDFEKWRNYGPNWRGKYGHSVVEAAAIAGRVDIVKEWIEAGLSPADAIKFAAMNGRLEVVDLLILSGVDVNQIDSEGRTPLDWASWQKDFASVLRTRGAKTAEELRTGRI